LGIGPEQQPDLLFNYFFQPDNRMAFVTSLIFLFLGIIFVLLANNSRNQDDIAHVLFFPAVSLSYFVLTSYVLGVSDIFRIQGINISPLTAFSLFFLCMAILFLKPTTWLMRILVGPGLGSIMGRRLLPWILVLPVVISWLRIEAYQEDYFAPEIGAILVAITYTLAFLFLVGWSAWSVNRIDESIRKAQDALVESEARLNALITATSDGVYRMSPDWKQMVNMEGGIFLNSVEKPVDDWLNNFIPKDSQPPVLDAIHKAIHTKSKFELEHEVMRIDGSIGWTLSRAIPVLDESGEIVEWLGIAHDFTERKETERKMGQLSAIIQHAELAISSKDLNGMIQTWNAGAEKIYGYTAEEVIGKNVSILIPEGENNEFTEIIDKVLQDEKIEIFETNRLRKDGTVISVSITLSPIRDASGDIVAISSISADISELRKIQEALRAKERAEDVRKGAEKAMYKLNEELMRSNQELQQFAYLASHDLQEPLRKILTFTQFLAQRYQGHFDKEGERFIHYIVENSLRMKGLIHDLLTYSMIGSRTSTFAEVDFNLVFERVIQSLGLIIQEKNALVTRGVLPTAAGDEARSTSTPRRSTTRCSGSPPAAISASSWSTTTPPATTRSSATARSLRSKISRARRSRPRPVWSITFSSSRVSPRRE
jgi:PAS domain S-box-containing protein